MKKRIIFLLIGVLLVTGFFVIPYLMPSSYNLSSPNYRVLKYDGDKYYFTLYKYDPPFTPPCLLASRDEADYSTPEGTRLASVSAKQRDTKWFLSLFDEDLQREMIESIMRLGGEQNFEKHKDKPLPEPRDAYLYKVEFDFEGEQYAVIRALLTIFIYEKEKSFQQESNVKFIKKRNIWLRTSLPPFAVPIFGLIGNGGYKKAMEISKPQQMSLVIGYWRKWGRIIDNIKGIKKGQGVISERIRKVKEIFKKDSLKKQEIAQKIKDSKATLEERLFLLNIQPLEGKAPDFTLSDLEGKGKVSLSDFKGKVVILYCWYVDWFKKRPEPLEDILQLNKLAQRFGDRGLVVLTVHQPRKEKPKKPKEASSFAMEEKLIFINLQDTGPYGDVANLYKTAGVPEAIIIDKEGNLIGKCPRYPKNWTNTEVIGLFDLLIRKN